MPALLLRGRGPARPGVIEHTWVDDRTLHVQIPGVVDWSLHVGPTPSTRMMSGHLGQLALTGQVPNGQRYRMGPSRVWLVHASDARVDGVDLGPIGPLPQQARLGDFWIPQRGLLAHGRVWLDQPTSG